MEMRCVRNFLVFVLMVGGLTACIGNNEPEGNTNKTYKISGFVSGLEGSGLIIQNNLSDDLGLDEDGVFSFPSKHTSGSTYSVTISAQPFSPSQTCTIANGSGLINNDDIVNIAITCEKNTFSIGGIVSGLSGSGLELQVNGGDDLAIPANGNFVFATPLEDLSSYSVTVKSQPQSPSQTCTVSDGSASLSGENITDVSVNCVTNSFVIGGNVSGLLGEGLELQVNGGDDLLISADGTFAFDTPLPDESSYTVMVKIQPSSPNQSCGLNNNSGVLSGTDISNIFVSCISACDDNEIGIIDACGVAYDSPLDLHDPVSISLRGLSANTRHTIVITDPSAAEITPAGGLIATSDGDGNINKLVIVQNMDPAAALGDYTVSVDEQAVPTGAPQTLSYTVENRSRVECVNNTDSPQASFLSSDIVFARVTKNDGALTDGNYDLYVVSDLQKPLANGGLIGGAPTIVTVAGGSGTVPIGSFSVGAYDVVVDVNGDGIFNQGTDLISRHNRLLPCFSVQAPNSGLAMVEQIVSDKNGNKREIFDPDADVEAIRDIHAYVTPTEQSIIQQPGTVRTYLVNHQAVWADGNSLTDVAGGAKIMPIQDDSNSEAPWVLAPFSSLAALGGATCYDVVVDTNGNGQFDVGVDYVDNVDHLGNNACGVRVSTSGCTNITISSHSDGDNVAETAILLQGSISGAPVEVYVTNTSGNQSNTFAITLSAGSFSANLPLFDGDNHITVSAVYTDNSSCSETITIRALTEPALFRAQLTWDGSTDMDLHVVRPNAEYYNPNIADTGTEGDCYYGNCNVGLAGTGSNSIEWGLSGEDDDPKLDVDCIACGNGIENIWMEQINEDGDYKVYVDAYNGTETNVTVTIFILGAAVAQVNCGLMQAASAADSCFVGTISWLGGSRGVGTFIPAGSKAADF